MTRPTETNVVQLRTRANPDDLRADTLATLDDIDTRIAESIAGLRAAADTIDAGAQRGAFNTEPDPIAYTAELTSHLTDIIDQLRDAGIATTAAHTLLTGTPPPTVV